MCVDVAYSDPVKRRAATRLRQLRVDAYIREQKSVPCMDCGQTFPPYVMQFDHVTGVKEFTLGDVRRVTTNMERVKAEVAKCQVVCANCHAIRTYTRLASK